MVQRIVHLSVKSFFSRQRRKPNRASCFLVWFMLLFFFQSDTRHVLSLKVGCERGISIVAAFRIVNGHGDRIVLARRTVSVVPVAVRILERVRDCAPLL